MADKVYYSIGEVAEMFRVNASLIRYWETEFSILKPKKNKKGNRLFTSTDIQVLQQIYSLVKEKGYTLQGAKEVLKKKKRTSNEDSNDLLTSLKQIRTSLLELRSEVDKV